MSKVRSFMITIAILCILIAFSNQNISFLSHTEHNDLSFIILAFTIFALVICYTLRDISKTISGRS